jgi:hypothetical protein
MKSVSVWLLFILSSGVASSVFAQDPLDPGTVQNSEDSALPESEISNPEAAPPVLSPPPRAQKKSALAPTPSSSSSSAAAAAPVLSLPSENLPIVSARPLSSILGLQIGDRVQFEVENFRAPGKYRSYKVIPEGAGMKWAKIGIQPTDSITLNEGSLRFFISPLKEGTIGPLRLKLMGVDPDASIMWVELPALEVTGLQKGDEPPPAFLEPQDIPFPWKTAALYGFIALIILGTVIYWIVRAIRSRKKPEVAKRKKPRKPEDVVALAKLDKLAKTDYLAKQNYKAYYFTLSDLFKEYLDRRYEIKASESTSYELLELLRGKSIDPELLKAVEFTFERLDFVKFTDNTPPAPEPETLHALVRNWVTKTRRVPNAV